MSGENRQFIKKKRAENNDNSKGNFYVDKQEMYDALVEYHERKKENPDEIISDYIVKCFMDIADGVGRTGRFRQYPDLEDMKQDAVMLCIKYIDSFKIDRENKNPYSYFTSVVTNGFLANINSERRYRYKQYKAIENSMLFETITEMQEIDDSIHEEAAIYSKHAQENMFNFIGEYEDAIQRKKERALERAKENANKQD